MRARKWTLFHSICFHAHQFSNIIPITWNQKLPHKQLFFFPYLVKIRSSLKQEVNILQIHTFIITFDLFEFSRNIGIWCFAEQTLQNTMNVKRSKMKTPWFRCVKLKPDKDKNCNILSEIGLKRVLARVIVIYEYCLVYHKSWVNVPVCVYII